MSPPDDQKPEESSSASEQEKKKPKLNLLGHAQDVLNQTNDIIVQSFQSSGKSSTQNKGNSVPPAQSNTPINPEALGAQTSSALIADQSAGEGSFDQQNAGDINSQDLLNTLQSVASDASLSPNTQEQTLASNDSQTNNTNSGMASDAGLPFSAAGSFSSGAPNNSPPLNSTFVFINPAQEAAAQAKSNTEKSNTEPSQIHNHFNQTKTVHVKEESSSLGAWVIIFVFLLLFSVTGLGYIYLNHPEWLGLGKPKDAPTPIETTPEAPTEIVVPPAATDLAGTPHEEVIQDLISLNLVSMDQRSFHPMNTLTRGEFVTWLVKTWNRTHNDNNNLRYISSESVSFPDVTSEDPAYSYIQMLARTGYIYGYEDGSFKPNQAITREEMLYMADGIHKMQREAPSAYYHDLLKKVYLDGDQADLKYVRAIYDNQYRNQYVWGKTELLKPKEQVKRYEAALLLHTLKQDCPLEMMANTVRSQRKYTDSCAKPKDFAQDTYHAIQPIIESNTDKETP
jgi:hypothetical protein